MSILTGPAIRQALADGRAEIDPPPQHIGPNSVDLHLAPTLLVYRAVVEAMGWGEVCPVRMSPPLRPYTPGAPRMLDAQAANETVTLGIPSDGYVLHPGVLYLGSTVERTHTPHHVPYVDGRSSVGRLGIFVHCTAGRGDVGFNGNWTLEITCVHPVRIYAGMRIAQLTLHEVVGKIEPYAGRYQDARVAEASKLHWDGKR